MSNSAAPSGDFLERIVPQVREGGARNIVELAKALKMPVETTRYKVKGMLKRGLGIHASFDYHKFGLMHYYAYLQLSEKARSNEKKFFAALAEQAYLSSYARRLPSNEYVCKFSVPRTQGVSGGSLSRLLRGLVEEKFLEHSEIHDTSWEKAHMIQPEYFDLKHSTWKVDWNKVKKDATSAIAAAAKEKGESKEAKALNKAPPEFDDLDLEIARELEADALVRLSDIASNLKTTLNNIFYHFHKHIVEQKLVEEFVVRWNGSPREPSLFVQFQFSNVSVADERVVRAALRRLPFLWTDALSLDTGFYVAESMIPQNEYLDTLGYLSNSLSETAASRLKVYILDSRTRQQCPFPSQLFRDNEWKFESEEVVASITSKLRKS